ESGRRARPGAKKSVRNSLPAGTVRRKPVPNVHGRSLMAPPPLTNALRRLRAGLEGHGAGRTDGELLRAFLRRHDEDAFAALVHRHGPMVLGVCRRVLRHEQDAEDAFQAAFLVLARRAPAIRQRQSVGGYLHEIAYRLALKARAAAARRRARDQEAVSPPSNDPAAVASWQEFQALLDEELR